MGSKSNYPLELRLSLKPSYVPKTVRNLLSDLEKINDDDDAQGSKLSVLKDYLNKHKEELSRVEPFKRQIPQCMLLLMDAIEIIEEEITKSTKKMGTDDHDHQEEESESVQLQVKQVSEFQTSKNRTYEKELLQMMSSNNIINNNNSKKYYSCGQGIINYDHQDPVINKSFNSSPWSPNYHDLHTTQPCSGKGKKKLEVESANVSVECRKRKKNIQRLMEWDIEDNDIRVEQADVVAADNLFSDNPIPTWNIKIDNNITKRRTWTPELHASFVHALCLLGGPQVATPKQIRELMDFNGLTNDQVKSHLQKYRLHLRGLNPRNDEDRISGADYRRHHHRSARCAPAPPYDQYLPNCPNSAATAAETSITGGSSGPENEENDVVNSKSAKTNFSGWLTHF